MSFEKDRLEIHIVMSSRAPEVCYVGFGHHYRVTTPNYVDMGGPACTSRKLRHLARLSHQFD